MSARRLLALLAAAVLFTIASGLVQGSVMEYQGWDCPPGQRACPHPVAARGFPLLYLVDKEFLSPTTSVDIVGALMGLDYFRWPQFLADVVFWLALLLAVRALVARVRRR